MKTLANDKGYMGNVNLKRSNVSVDWTPDRIEEYMKCKNDVVYFVETYMKIINVDKGLISFVLYDYQKKMLRSMADNRFTIIATARQAGKSTVTCGFVLWYIIFHAEKVVAMLANKGDTAREILGRIQLAYEHLPNWLQQGVVEWNKGSFVLENESRVIASATSSSAIRGYTVNLLFIDEAAFIENWEQFFTSVFPTVSSGQSTKVILVSTPNGLNHFYKLWYDANHGRNNYHPIKVVWQDVPGRDEKWKADVLSSMGGDVEKFAQENCVEFLGSSGTLISGEGLKSLVFETPIVAADGLKQYAQPEKGHAYAIIVDVSRGKGLDYSAFSVIDVTKMPYIQVAAYRNNVITPGDYAEVVYRLGKAYNMASALVEINDIGEEVANILYNEYEYESILYTESAGRAGKRISAGFGKGVDRGIRTTKVIKSVGCTVLKLLIEQHQLIVKDWDTINELSTFSRKANSYEAEPGKHDDLVMGLVLFAWLTNQKYFKEMTDIDTLMSLKQKTEEEVEEGLIMFGFVDDGREDDMIEEAKTGTGSTTWFTGDW